jgi:hypothetical protein
VRFLDGYAKANRLKPSGIASKETVLRVHLAKAFGDKRLDEISTEDVQRLKAALTERAPKTVNKVLTVFSGAEDGSGVGASSHECPARSSCSKRRRAMPASTISKNSNGSWRRLGQRRCPS